MCSSTGMTELTQQIKADIWHWIEHYIEVPNKFYDYRFPVCPFAKAARLQGIVQVRPWISGSIKDFIRQGVHQLIQDQQKEICVMVMPPRAKWRWGIPALIESINAEIIPQGAFVQFGTAIGTTSQYPGLFNQGEYFVVLVNNVDAVMEAHRALLNTDYYRPWSRGHYHDVVIRRQRLVEKYGKKH